MSDDDVWKRVISQVAVAGKADPGIRLLKSKQAQKDLAFDHLKSLSTSEQASLINKHLRAHGVRYASSDLGRCVKTRCLLGNFEFLAEYPSGPTAYMKYLAGLQNDEARIKTVIRDMKYIKNKGARDMLANLGLVTGIIALDARILGILGALGVNLPPDIQAKQNKYIELQDELIDAIATPEGITGVMLDKILFQNYDAILIDVRAL